MRGIRSPWREKFSRPGGHITATIDIARIGFGAAPSNFSLNPKTKTGNSDPQKKRHREDALARRRDVYALQNLPVPQLYRSLETTPIAGVRI
jgi:hypothetical protein